MLLLELSCWVSKALFGCGQCGPPFRRHISSTRFPFHWAKTVEVIKLAGSQNESHRFKIFKQCESKPFNTYCWWLHQNASNCESQPHACHATCLAGEGCRNNYRNSGPPSPNGTTLFEDFSLVSTFETYAGRSSDFILRFPRNPFQPLTVESSSILYFSQLAVRHIVCGFPAASITCNQHGDVNIGKQQLRACSRQVPRFPRNQTKRNETS